MSLRPFSLPDGAEVASFVKEVPLYVFSLPSSGTTPSHAFNRSGIPQKG
jgi:hypothetical protein